MYTQFFGNFLLNNKLVTPAQLSEAIELKKTTRLKLGVLAINAGYMTSQQVDEVHCMQQRVDKRIGDIAVDMGFMTAAQVDELLSSQKTGYLLLGQALVDRGYMSNAQFESAIKDYKDKYKMSEKDLTSEQTDGMKSLIAEFYHFDSVENAEVLIEYTTLLFKNVVRFIGDDFTPSEAAIVSSFKMLNLSAQNILGEYSAVTAFGADDDAYAGFASRFAGERLCIGDEFTCATVGEFLNLHNGLFTVNMSNEKEVELELTPQTFSKDAVLNVEKSAFCIPLVFPFGTINFLIGLK